MSAALRQNELVIRGCILYEVLDKKPIQESYEIFCGKVGNDVMPYYDFQFWFYRFYNGNHDLHHDRSADPVPPLLSNMPLNIIDEILNRMDILNLLVLMKVSQNFRKVVQNMKMVFDCIEVDFDEHLAITYNSRHKIKYRPNDTALYSPFRQEPTCTCGRTRIHTSDEDNKKVFFVTDEDYVELGVKDLKLIMENQNVQLKKFQFSNGSNQDTQKKFIDRAEIALKSAKSSTRTVEAHYNSFGELAQLLPIVQAGKLEEISFEGYMTDGYEQLVCLDQWKNARKFDGFWSFNIPIEHCLHFECFKDNFVRFKEEDAMKLRYMLDRSTSFGHADITIYPSIVISLSMLKKVFDVPNDKKPEFIYRTPDNRSFAIQLLHPKLNVTKLGFKFEYNNNSVSTFSVSP